jgi:predicted O-methyltransferase YrrM
MSTTRGTVQVKRLRQALRGFREGHQRGLRRGTTSLAPVPFPEVDLGRVSNPVPSLLAASEFDQADRQFVASGAVRRSLVSARGHAVVHALIRNQRPAHVVEIGTYHGGMTETMAQAVWANGGGTVHTVSPFDSDAFLPVYRAWPRELQQVVQFYPMDSMTFFMELDRRNIHPDLVVVDGNHDYAFALFDILCAAHRLTPGGFIIVSECSQAGPFFAVEDFLRGHPDWIDCADARPTTRDVTKSFDPARDHVDGTGFVILRAPLTFRLAKDRPRTFGELAWTKPEVRGLAVSLDGRQGRGSLHVQCILRGFGGGQPPAQEIIAASQEIEPGTRDIEVTLPQGAGMEPPRERYSIESWLIWTGRGPLCLAGVPSPF